MRQLKTMNAEELSELPFPPPAFIVKELIPHGLSVLAGAGKTGKSWLVLWLAMRVSQGLPVWERATQKCEVLYLCLEDTFPRIQRRMYRLNEEPVPELRFAVMCDKLHGGLEEQIAEQLHSYPNTGFIIIDTLQKVRDPRDADSGNMYACDYDAMASLKRIADEHDIGILLVHHIRKTKDSGDPFNEILGSNGVMGRSGYRSAAEAGVPGRGGRHAPSHGPGRGGSDTDAHFPRLRLGDGGRCGRSAA